MLKLDIIELIKKDLKEKQNKYIANKYYYYKPKKDNTNEIHVADANGNIKTIKLDKCVELYTNYFKLLVNQKIDYLLSRKPTLSSQLPFSVTEIMEMYELLMLNASLDGISWLHFYIENNVLNWIVVEDKEIIPIYDKHKKNIVSIVRYKMINKDEIYVEVWESTGVTTLTIDKNKITNEQCNQHFTVDTIYNDEIINSEPRNFKMIPFIPFLNNRDCESDLDGIKELLDYYNEINSGLISNVYKFQEALMKLKGFSGDSETLDEAMKNLKKYKMVGIPQDGDIDYMSVEIPVEARKLLLDILKTNIFRLGRGVDTDLMGDGGNITNIVIKSRYFPLDNKCNRLEKEANKFHSKFVQFINGTLDATIEFNRLQLFNESEKIQDCVMCIDLYTAGLLSKETLIAQIPYVVSVDDELKLIEKGQNLLNENSDKTDKNDEEDINNE